MTLPAVIGHEALRQYLARALAAGELPGALLFHGPAGVGRQRLALWLGELLLCESGGEEPCGDCAQCRLTARLEHPDLHWFFPLARPRGVGADRLADALEAARGAELASRRAEPLRAVAPLDMGGHFLAQMQTLRRYAAARPAMAARRVFVIGDAERLVPQESSPEAANALLKLLEEPPRDTTIVLTATAPAAILPTLRSRLLPVRVEPLPVDDVARLLITERGAAPETAATVARLAAGSIGAALAFLPADGAPGPLEVLRARARGWLEAATAGNAAAPFAAAAAQAPAGARGSFADTLGHFTLWLRDLAAVGAGAEDVVVNRDAIAWLRQVADRLPTPARTVPAAIERVETVTQWTQFNINPQLALGWLLRAVRRDLGVARAGST